MSVLMHVSPDDDPISGMPNTLFFYFTDKLNKFKLSECDCIVELWKGDEKLQNVKMQGSAVEVFFPKKAVYKVKIFAKSNINTFESFDIEYVLRVEREVDSNLFRTVKEYKIPILIFTIILALSLVLFKNQKNI